MWNMKRNCYELAVIFVLCAFALLVGATNSKAARFQYGGIVEQFTQTATAGGTTTLTVTSKQNQIFTGTLNQTVTLPDATTTSSGWYYWIINSSTGVVTVNDNGSNLVTTVNAGDAARIFLTSNASANGSWDVTTASSSGISFDINGLTEDSTIATGDMLAYYDAVNAVNRKIDFDNFKTAIATDNINRLTARAIATGDSFSFYDAATGESSKVDYDTVQSQIAATAITDPAGNDTEVQFNDGGVHGSDSTFVFDKSTNLLTIGDGGTNNNALYVDGGTTSTASPSGTAVAFIQSEASENALEIAAGTGDFDSSGGTVGFQFVPSSGLSVMKAYGSIAGFEGYGTSLSLQGAVYIRNDGRIVLQHGTSDDDYIAGGTSAGVDLKIGSTTNASKGQIELGEDGSEVVLGDDSSTGTLLRFFEIATPSTPSSNFGNVFLDSSTGELSIVKDTGGVVSLEGSDVAGSSVWDAIVGSAAEVTAGRATHSDFDTAVSAIDSGDSVFVLPGTHSCGGALPWTVHIRGAGRGSVLDCAITVAATQSHSWISGIKFTDNVTIATGSGGNVLNPVWYSADKGTINTGDASGNANYIIQFEED